MAAKGVSEDFTGRRYGAWTVLAFAFRKNRASYWVCRCDCGNERTIYGAEMKRGGTTNCGCIRAIKIIASVTKHGHTKGKKPTKEYQAWSGMIRRCEEETNKSYHNYGGRGIEVCHEWRDYERFFADMGPKPSPGHSIERINNDLGYSKENCTWATKKEQANNRRTNVFVTIDGERLRLLDACRKTGIPYTAVISRRCCGWPESRWFAPVRGHGA